MNKNSDAILLIGLGNPGKEYEDSRHNVGFNIIESIQRKYNFNELSFKYSSLFTLGRIESHKVFLSMPQTFMNLSGVSIHQIVNFYKIQTTNIFVFHDDLDLKLGQVKIKLGGGSGGHNGLNSIDNYISNNYFRIRIGIDKPVDKTRINKYVLSKFSKKEQEIISLNQKLIVDNLNYILNKDFTSLFQNLSRENEKNGI